MRQYDLDFREYWRILKKRKFNVIFIAVLLGFFSTAFAVLQAPEPIYVSASEIKFKKETPVKELFAGTVTWTEGNDILTQASMVKSYTVLQEVARELNLIPQKHINLKGRSKNHIFGVIENLQSKVKVSREGVTDVLKIEVMDKDPILAQRLANAIARTYKKLHAEQQMKRTTEPIKYIGDRLREVNIKLRESEDAYNRFSRDNQLISIDLQSENFLARTLEIQKTVRELQEDSAEFQGILDRLSQFIKDPSRSDLDFQSKKAGSRYQRANDKLMNLMIRKDTLLKSHNSKHPEVQAINSQIIGDALMMTRFLQIQIKDIEKRESNLRNEMVRFESMMQALLDKRLELDRLKRSVEMHKEITKLLEQKNEEALIRRAEKSEEITIINPAMLPRRPINPPKTIIMGTIGTLVGLLLGLVTAFLTETFDTSLGAVEDVEAILGTQVLGVIPHADAKDIREGLKERFPVWIPEHALTEAANLISHFVPKSRLAESFRSLRTNIRFKDVEKKIKTIAVASATLQEGKTIVAMNLAITMAQGGMKVLLVGCDLIKSMVAERLGLDRSPGLTDILLGSYDWRDTVKGVTDLIMGKMTMEEIMMTPGMDNLHVITSGAVPPNPADLVGSGRVVDFIQEAKQAYDIVIFDSTPILSASGAAILGRNLDGVLLVCRVGNISRGLLKRSTTRLKQMNCNIIGAVLNGMAPEISPDVQDYKNYGYYFSHGGAEGDEKDKGYMSRLSFFNKIMKGEVDSQKDVDMDRKRKSSQKVRRKKPKKMKMFFLFVALGFLASGLLWQNGVGDPFEWIYPDKPVEKKPTNANPKRKVPTSYRKRMLELAKTVSSKAKKITEDTVSEKKGINSEAPEGKASNKRRVLNAQMSPFEAPPALKKAIDPAETAAPEEKKISQDAPPKEPVPLAGPAENVHGGNKPVAVHKAQVKEAPAYPYSLYIGSFKTLKRANRAVSIYTRKGLRPAYNVKVSLSNGVWYRVYMGYFENSEAAVRFRLDNELTETEVKKTPYANLIGTYSSTATLEDKIRALKKHGFSPYVITDQGGRYRLFIGAFYPEARAERQHHELKSKGVSNKIVKR